MNRRRLIMSSTAGIVLAIGASMALAQDDKLSSDPSPVLQNPATPQADPSIYSGDVRDLWVKPWVFDDSWAQFSGEINQIRVAPPGYGFPVGNDSTTVAYFRTQIVMDVKVPGNKKEEVLVVINADVPNVYEGDMVIVVGKPSGEHAEEVRVGGGYWPFNVVVANSVMKDSAGTPET